MPVMRVVAFLLFVAAVLLGGLYLNEKRAFQIAARQNGELKEAAKGLEAQLAKLRQENESLREIESTDAAAVTVPRKEQPKAAPALPEDDSAARAELTRQLEEKEQQLTTAMKVREDLAAKVQGLEARVQALAEESQRLAQSDRQFREQMEADNRQVAALQADLRNRDERLLRLEVENRDLKRRSEDSSTRYTRLSKMSDDLGDLSRRREVYVTNILRRYREVTDLYRTVLVSTDAPRDDVSRIQNAISLAEEDLRHLQSLNAQAAKLQRDLAAGRK